MSADTCIFDIQSICATCLSRDRKLFSVSNLQEFVKFYSKISLTQTDKVCWECLHTMQRMVTFINRAHKAQAWLQERINGKNCDSMVCLSTLSISEPLCLSSTDMELTSYDATVPDPIFVAVKEDIRLENETSFNNISEFKDEIEVEILNSNERLKVENPLLNEHTTVVSTTPIHNVELPTDSIYNMGPHIDTLHMHNDIPPVNIMHDIGLPFNTVNMNNIRPHINAMNNNILPNSMLHMHNMRPHMNTMTNIGVSNKAMHKHNNIGPHNNTARSNGPPINIEQNTRWPNNMIYMHNIGPHINTIHMYNGTPPSNTMHYTGLHMHTMNMHNEGPQVGALNNIGPPINTPHNIRLPDNTMHMHNMRPHVNTMNYIGLPDNTMHMHNIGPHINTMHNIGSHMDTVHNTELPINTMHMHNIGPPLNAIPNLGPINTMPNLEPHMNIMNNTEPHINIVHNIGIPINTMHSTELPTSEIRKIRIPYTDVQKKKVLTAKERKTEDIKNTPAADPPDYIYTEETLTEEGMLKWRETKRSMDFVTQRPPEFRCDSCIEPFKTSCLLEEHARKHTELYGDLECDICTQRFAKEEFLEGHRKLHYRVLKCRYCEFAWDDANGMREHCSDQHDVKQTVWHCEPCQQEFPRRWGLLKHYRRNHRRIRCKECGVQLSAVSLSTHMIIHRGGRPVHICEECGKPYRGLVGLHSHMKIHSTEVDPKAYCGECDIRFRNTDRLRYHMRNSVKHGGKSYLRCEKCSKAFKKASMLENHKLKYHDTKRIYSCDICNQTFRSVHGRLHHRRRKHEGKLLPKDKICDYCGRAFTHKHLLATHINTHTGARPFVCKLCGADFGHKSALYLHGRLKHKIRDKHGQLLQRKKSKTNVKSKKVCENYSSGIKNDEEGIIKKVVRKVKSKRGSGKDKSEKLDSDK